MIKICGIVRNIRFSTEVVGSQDSTSTSHIAIFELDGIHVELKMSDSIILNNGDEVVVAGKDKNGLFKATAYRNITTGVCGKNSTFIYFLVGVIFTLVGIATAIFFIGLIFLAIGIYLIYTGIQTSKTYELVMLND
jgi:hypothetical protein